MHFPNLLLALAATSVVAEPMMSMSGMSMGSSSMKMTGSMTMKMPSSTHKLSTHKTSPTHKTSTTHKPTTTHKPSSMSMMSMSSMKMGTSSMKMSSMSMMPMEKREEEHWTGEPVPTSAEHKKHHWPHPPFWPFPHHPHHEHPHTTEEPCTTHTAPWKLPLPTHSWPHGWPFPHPHHTSSDMDLPVTAMPMEARDAMMPMPMSSSSSEKKPSRKMTTMHKTTTHKPSMTSKSMSHKPSMTSKSMSHKPSMISKTMSHKPSMSSKPKTSMGMKPTKTSSMVKPTSTGKAVTYLDVEVSLKALFAGAGGFTKILDKLTTGGIGQIDILEQLNSYENSLGALFNKALKTTQESEPFGENGSNAIASLTLGSTSTVKNTLNDLVAHKKQFENSTLDVLSVVISGVKNEQKTTNELTKAIVAKLTPEFQAYSPIVTGPLNDDFTYCIGNLSAKN